MQKTVSLSTAEAEYYSASEMAIEVLYLRNLLANMGFEQAPDTPVYEDIFTKPLQLQQFKACHEGLLTGQRGQVLPPRGPSDSGGGKKSPSSRVLGWMLQT